MKRILLNSTLRRRHHSGMTLIEIALVMVLVSLALVPVVKMIGGPQSASGEGTVDRITAQKSKEILLANTLVENTLAGDYSSFNCGGAFTPSTGLPKVGSTISFPSASRCVSNNYNQSLYYQWSVRNMDASGADMPEGNHYYTAVLNVWDSASSTTPLLTLPTSFFWNESGAIVSKNSTGIVIIQDTSGSMASASVEDGSLPAIYSGSNILASPYLHYRYADSSLGYSPKTTYQLDINQNSQLDIVTLYNKDDSNTDWDDRYLRKNVLNTTSCTAGVNNVVSELAQNNTYQQHVDALCNAPAGPNNPAWENVLNDHLSRIEASRSSLLSFLLSIEADHELYENTKLGFISFSDNVTNRVLPLESVNASNKYAKMRRSLSWLNRQGPGDIPASGSTNMYAALQSGANVLFADKTLDNRIIFFVGDGSPTVGKTDHASFQKLSTSIGDGTYDVNGKTATIFTLGLLSTDSNLPKYMRDDIANRTPGGQFFYAQSMGDVAPIFDQIKYQIQRVILLNKSNRYNVDFT